jgi:hypothetical protein
VWKGGSSGGSSICPLDPREQVSVLMQKEKMTLLLNEWTYFPPVGRIEASTVGYGNTPFTTSNAAFRMGNLGLLHS